MSGYILAAPPGTTHRLLIRYRLGWRFHLRGNGIRGEASSAGGSLIPFGRGGGIIAKAAAGLPPSTDACQRMDLRTKTRAETEWFLLQRFGVPVRLVELNGWIGARGIA